MFFHLCVACFIDVGGWCTRIFLSFPPTSNKFCFPTHFFTLSVFSPGFRIRYRTFLFVDPWQWNILIISKSWLVYKMEGAQPVARNHPNN